jgi:hypothetical protein
VEVLQELGLDDASIRRLLADGIVATPEADEGR